ncbi:DUF952 domain-containing protein [Brevibacillus laterosporus]|uniref:DUF952 domain-containing protein n=1 Tax=Brevibacillus laterosporus TaxID=1465 RepID=A0A502I5H0_BRELA|nr:DUF952 domain-containing protein [Brevibacillus laterosporus]QDX91203.1 DUF952 domain-containing protein [Brevibacillus laterosporus]RAP20662.1 hypothetical protein C2W64_03880 [Brevibacillus laterosporus]TPG80922.1 DUF952 domain-containing protein [Brevibacillus laterosporus]
MVIIVKISTEQQWNTAKEQGIYLHPSLETEGFIHCSTPDQFEGVANRIYKGQNNLLLLVIDPTRLSAELKYDPAKDGQLYPHIYGPLNVDAVIRVISFSSDKKGYFSLPAELSSL